MKTGSIGAIGTVAAVVLTLAGCSGLDVVGSKAITTFGTLMEKEATHVQRKTTRTWCSCSIRSH